MILEHNYFIRRQGSTAVTKEFTITTGLKLTKSKTVTTTAGFEHSITASLSVPIKGLTAGMESTTKFYAQIESSLSSSEEKYWSKQTKTTYTAPAGKKYRVVQTLLDFSSPLELDDSTLYNSERIEESD